MLVETNNTIKSNAAQAAREAYYSKVLPVIAADTVNSKVDHDNESDETEGDDQCIL